MEEEEDQVREILVLPTYTQPSFLHSRSLVIPSSSSSLVCLFYFLCRVPLSIIPLFLDLLSIVLPCGDVGRTWIYYGLWCHLQSQPPLPCNSSAVSRFLPFPQPFTFIPLYSTYLVQSHEPSSPATTPSSRTALRNIAKM